MATSAEKKVFKKVLNNGLTILVRPNHLIPKVSLQLWYNVGSKDEKTGEKGLAHLLEHMIFKGTQRLSESDINLITNKLSGSCNAFTSYDYTGYLFDMPSHHWHAALDMLADCMQNCTFRQEFLNSEMKAVIQELKMYRDNYPSTLIETMISTIFPDHPYHYPIIGFKQHLWDMKSQTLINFYKKHYIPNNATLVAVGDISPDELFGQAEELFGQIKPNPAYKKETFYHHLDLLTQSITLYREIAQPIIMQAFTIPGARAGLDYPLDVLAWILGSGKSSRLQHKLIDDLQLVNELDCFTYDLFDYGVFFIYFQPKRMEDIDLITRIIHDELADIAKHGINTRELQAAMKKTQIEYLNVLESNQKQAYLIGQSYLATGNDQFLFTYLSYPTEQVSDVISSIVKTYLRPSLMHRGAILPTKEQDKETWLLVQKESDTEDARILSNVKRTQPVEEGMFVNTITPSQPKSFTFPKPQDITLSNGLRVLYYNNPNTPTIDTILMLKSKNYFDPQDQQGLYHFMCSMLDEGTKSHPNSEFARVVESYGMTFHASPGYLSLNMLSADFERGLSLLNEVVTESSFDEDAIEKIREQILADISDYWDSPNEFASHLAREQVYKNHPYSKLTLGLRPVIEKLQRTDLLHTYKQFITPKEAIIAIVGDLNSYDIKAVLEKTLARWTGPQPSTIAFPPLEPIVSKEVIFPINRDQVVLCFAGNSITRTDKRYDKLLLFDQVFTGGVLGSMSSRLFQLREQSGLFYTIGGSLLKHADEQPGMVYIKTIVSLDRLAEAEQAIKNTIHSAALNLEESELDQAKNGLINSFVDNFESNRQIAATFLLLERYGLPADYFDKRPAQLLKLTREEVQKTAHEFLHNEELVTIKIGRL